MLIGLRDSPNPALHQKRVPEHQYSGHAHGDARKKQQNFQCVHLLVVFV